MKARLMVCLLCLCLAAPGGARSQQSAYDPVSAYQSESINGFTVLINRQVLAHEPDAAEVRRELERQLEEISRVLPTGPLASLRGVSIWVEWNRKEGGGAEFHPSAAWLRDHGYNPEKAGGVEISNTRNFVEWSGATQPCMVLHELAHAYHFLVLGVEDPAVAAAYRNAVETGLYEEVGFVSGGKKKAYALTNRKEYFAELSEAFFGKNDFYPFTRSDLERHDPVGFKALQKAWGKPPAAPSVRTVTPHPDPWRKVEIDLTPLDANGLRGPADGKVAVSYEFSIPNTDRCRRRVQAIDRTVQFMPGSPGRIGADGKACLCIGSTHQEDYRGVLFALAELPFIDRIIECHFE